MTRLDAHRHLSDPWSRSERMRNIGIARRTPTTRLWTIESRSTFELALASRRGAHVAVLAYCREGLVRKDHYEAVFEAIKGPGARIRSETGVDADGYALIEKTMAGSAPTLRINNGRTRTERDEQLGIANLAKGLFSAFRNPVAHEPKLYWTMSELDALDVMGTLSMIHRRLDAAIRENSEGA